MKLSFFILFLASATQSIRTFGKSVDGWLRTALGQLSERLKTIKLTIINAFAMTLRRYTSLNHLAQAARAVLLNSTQVNQMLADLNKVDFHNVQEQAWWICECDDNLVSRIEREFKNHLSSQSTLEDWSQWLDSLLNDLLKPHSNLSAEKYTKQAKQILLNWSYYCSMVIRDLTLRSAASFGSFHLIRLLYDEYLFYLIEHKIAVHSQKTPIAVMADVRRLFLFFEKLHFFFLS
jgi:regulatory factor X 1/2/3